MRILFFRFDVPANSNGLTLARFNLTPPGTNIRRRIIAATLDDQDTFARFELRVGRDLRWSVEKSDIDGPDVVLFPVDVTIEPGEVAELEIISSFNFGLDVEGEPLALRIEDELVP